MDGFHQSFSKFSDFSLRGGSAQDVGGFEGEQARHGFGVLTHVCLAGELSTKHATILLPLG